MTLNYFSKFIIDSPEYNIGFLNELYEKESQRFALKFKTKSRFIRVTLSLFMKKDYLFIRS